MLAAFGCEGAPCRPALQAEAGRGDEVDALGVGWDQPLARCDEETGPQVHLLGRLDHWKGRAPEPAVKDVADVSLTPFLRWFPTFAGMPIHIDVGIGVHAISHTRINAERKMSTAFQFGEFIGASMPLGARGDYELGVRLQHVSNGGIKHPNDGITYPLFVVARTF